MRPAPPVAVHCTAGLTWRGVQTALPALASGVFIFWGLSWLEAGSMAVRVLAALAVALVIAALAWQRCSVPAQVLDWDGQRWALDGQPGVLQLMIDLGPALLLRHGGSRWLVATHREAGAAWHGLRAAVLSPTMQSATGDGVPRA